MRRKSACLSIATQVYEQRMPRRTTRREKTSETSDQMETVEDKDSLAMCVIELLKDEKVLQSMKEVLFPKNLMDSINALTGKMDTSTRELDEKNAKINQLEQRVDCFEDATDGVEQYSCRPNLRFYGISENWSEDDTEKLLTTVINESMQLQPPMPQDYLERSLRMAYGSETQSRWPTKGLSYNRAFQ